MERAEIKPTELSALAKELIAQLRAEGAEIRIPTGPDPERERADAERRRRDEEAMRKDAAERRERMIAATLAHVLPPPVHAIVTGPKIERTQCVDAALTWFRDGRSRVRGLILRGGTRIGKTVAAGLVGKESIESGKRSVSWHRPNDFVSAVLHQYDENAPELGRDLVIIDDMGRETKADFQEAVCAFLDSYATRFLITTNDTEGTTAARYDVRLVKRLEEQCMSLSIHGRTASGRM